MFNYWEKIIAKSLSSFPILKSFAKKGYSRLAFITERKKYSFQADKEIRELGEPKKESFFGYYDKSPSNKSNNYILFQESSYLTHKKPNPSYPVKIILQKDSGEIVKRFLSSAYNWQQGTKLQWISDTKFVFNDYDASLDSYVAHVYDVTLRKIVYTLPVSIYDCFGEEFALTLNYDRLALLAPDYGYFNRIEQPINLDNLENDGVYSVNMQSGQSKLIISLSKLKSLSTKLSMKNANHTVNHIMISPNGDKFMVIHRWYKNRRRFDRLILADNNGENIKIVADNEMVSHCFWVKPNLILGYLRGINDQDGYWLINTETLDYQAFSVPPLDKYGDGHCHINGDWFVTDTYPDKSRMQHLFLCNWKTGEVTELGEFFHGFRFNGESRCDLHPRFSIDGKNVFFDSVFQGKRRMYQLKLQNDV